MQAELAKYRTMGAFLSTDNSKQELELVVDIASASGLPSRDRNGLSDPFVTVWVNDLWRCETRTVFETLEPVWDEQVATYCRSNDSPTTNSNTRTIKSLSATLNYALSAMRSPPARLRGKVYAQQSAMPFSRTPRARTQVSARGAHGQ